MNLRTDQEDTDFKSVLDHGVTVNLDTVPKLGCSKFTIIGNSKMRVKRRMCEPNSGPMWQIPAAVRQMQRERIVEEQIRSSMRRSSSAKPERPLVSHKDPTLDQSPLIAKRKHLVFNESFEINKLDQNSIYSIKHEDAFNFFPPLSGDQITIPNPAYNKEKMMIRNFYRKHGKGYFPPVSSTKSILRACSPIRLPIEVNPIDGETFRGNYGNKTKRKHPERRESLQYRYHYHTRHICDVVGPKYCSDCRRIVSLKLVEHEILPEIKKMEVRHRQRKTGNLPSKSTENYSRYSEQIQQNLNQNK